MREQNEVLRWLWKAKIVEKCGLLNPFYTTSRYPDIEELTDKKSNQSAAQDAITAAEKVVKWCEKQIKI